MDGTVQLYLRDSALQNKLDVCTSVISYFNDILGANDNGKINLIMSHNGF